MATNPIERFKNHIYINQLLNLNMDTECNRNYFDLYTNYILPLQNGYTWFVAPIKQLEITVTCENYQKKHSSRNNFLLTLSHDCKALLENELMIPTFERVSSKINEIHISFNFSKDEEILFKS